MLLPKHDELLETNFSEITKLLLIQFLEASKSSMDDKIVHRYVQTVEKVPAL